MKKQTLWLRCEDCGLHLRCPETSITLPPHFQESGKAKCPAKLFAMLEELSDTEIQRAGRERNRREKKYALLHPPKRRKPFEKRKSTSHWDGVRATSARPSRGTAGASTLGKR